MSFGFRTRACRAIHMYAMHCGRFNICWRSSSWQDEIRGASLHHQHSRSWNTRQHSFGSTKESTQVNSILNNWVSTRTSENGSPVKFATGQIQDCGG